MDRTIDVVLRHRRVVLAVWGLLCLVGAVFAVGLPGRIVSGGEAPASSQSSVVADALAGSPLPSLFVSVKAQDGTDLTAVTQRVAAGAAAVKGVTHVSPMPDTPALNPAGARVAVLDVSTNGGTDGATTAARALQKALGSTPGADVHVGGFGAYRDELTTDSQKDLERAERFGIPIVLVVLLLTFGSLWAAGMPLVIALSALVMGLGGVGVASFFVPMSDFVTNSATMIGLALGVDYAMFLVQRVRELVRAGRTIDAAIREAMATTGRAVLWSGVTVLLAEATLFLVDSRSIRSAALGMVLVTLFAIGTALLVGPVVISLFGNRMVRRRQHARTREGGWHRWARHVTRRAPIYLVASIVLMAGLAIPSLRLHDKVNIAGTSSLPAGSSVRTAYETAAARYGAPALSPVIALLPGADAQVAAARISSDPDVAAVTAQPLSGATTALVVTAKSDPYSPQSRSLVHRLRSELPAASIGGETAASIDATDAMFAGLPKVGIALLLVVALMLLLALRSVFLPIKAVLLVILSLGASLGSLFLLATTRLGATLIGADGPQDIHPIVPITIVAITVALSTDYEVILISRMAERYRRSRDNRAAIIDGVGHTGSVITSAAAIMVAVFTGFALADLAPLKQLGVGLALAVVLDATVVRGVLVPAAMAIMGRGNWWWPTRRRPAAIDPAILDPGAAVLDPGAAVASAPVSA